MHELGLAARYEVIELKLQHCPNRSGELKVVWAIQQLPVIRKILTLLPLDQNRRPQAGPDRQDTAPWPESRPPSSFALEVENAQHRNPVQVAA